MPHNFERNRLFNEFAKVLVKHSWIPPEWEHFSDTKVVINRLVDVAMGQDEATLFERLEDLRDRLDDSDDADLIDEAIEALTPTTNENTAGPAPDDDPLTRIFKIGSEALNRLSNQQLR